MQRKLSQDMNWRTPRALLLIFHFVTENSLCLHIGRVSKERNAVCKYTGGMPTVDFSLGINVRLYYINSTLIPFLRLYACIEYIFLLSHTFSENSVAAQAPLHQVASFSTLFYVEGE